MKLAAHEVRCGYGAQDVLRGVSLELREGELYGLVGPNGAGKSTLLRCLYGAQPLSGGEVVLGERPLPRWGRRAIARVLGVVPQRSNPAFPVAVRHFVGMGRFAREPLLGGPTREDERAVDACLAELGLVALADRAVDELSGGEFRRVLIAQALAQEPAVLLFDEPVQQLDLKHQLEVMEFARAFARRAGASALIVLHDLGLAARYCDRLGVLHAGHLVAEGPPDATLTVELLRRVWGVEASLERSPATGALHVVPLREARDA
ncbi:MAG: ABC transporter ATP-binding protein [Planctomycetes bacterium]|nr:ABC transporter ATP-binding protein [Planctomycetota bacterium]